MCPKRAFQLVMKAVPVAAQPPLFNFIAEGIAGWVERVAIEVGGFDDAVRATHIAFAVQVDDKTADRRVEVLCTGESKDHVGVGVALMKEV